MQLPIPIFRNDKIYVKVDFDEPNADVISRAYTAVNKGLAYKAIYEFVSGSIDCIYDETGEPVRDKAKIKRLCGMMPYVSADALVLKILACMKEGEDYIEGVYVCPRCGYKIITGKDGISDTRDRIGALEIVCMEEYDNSIYVELKDTIKISNTQTGEILEEMHNFELRHPTLNDFMIAENGQNNNLIIQYRAYCNALRKVNTQEIDDSWKSKYGLLMLKKAKATSLSQINQQMKKYGMIQSKIRECPECSKEWESPLNTSSFFVSGLRPM